MKLLIAFITSEVSCELHLKNKLVTLIMEWFPIA